ncbi:MAG: ABC transporter permease [Lachnospiraceae bacterium]|nr:ABC transporter permease [Lachnospiraceae bacterium]
MKYIGKKLIALAITLLAISFVTFFAFTIIPGDAATSIMGMDASEEQLDALREELGLNDPLIVRYGRWVKGALMLDFGTSLQYKTDVAKLIGGRLTATLGLALEAILIILILSVPLGIISSKKPNGAVDNIITVLTQFGMAVPQFFLGIMLTYVFGILLRIVNMGGYVNPAESFDGFLRFLILPAITVAIPKLSMMTKYLRDCIVAQKKQDYVRTARAKGNSEGRILTHHVLKNAIIPSITFFAMIVADVLAGSIVCEQVFAIPGVGRLLTASISNRDFPVVSAIVLYVAVVVVVMNTLADVFYRVVDPRVK